MEKSIRETERDQRELIHILHEVQSKLGYIPAEAISQISRRLKISESEIFGVLTSTKPFLSSHEESTLSPSAWGQRVM